MLGKPDKRDREAEFDLGVWLTLQEAKQLIEESFNLLENTIHNLSDDDLLNQQTVRGKVVTVYDVLNQCIAHFSEHLGQVLYVAKMLLADKYVCTSIPKKCL
jgi:CTP-dependent riboflavin kinase